MTLVEKINQDYLAAYKNRETETVNTLRLLLSALKNEAIKGAVGTELTDQQAMAVLNREAKQRHDSISQYQAAGRQELADQEKQELAIIESYLPQALDQTAIEALVADVLQETGAKQKSDMGTVMAALKVKLDNPADISRAAGIVSQRLQ